MSTSEISKAELLYIVHGVEAGLRNDGRNNQEYRDFQLDTGVLQSTYGSSRVRIAQTEIMVGVKAELKKPDCETPDQGRIEFFYDCSANATPEFEGRGGESLGLEIASCLSEAYASDVFPLSSLCIFHGAYCWVLYVDILLLECGGDLFDATAIAVKAALKDVVLPNMIAKAIAPGKLPDLELSTNREGVRLMMDDAPCLVTLCKIGLHFVVDASREEESCATARLIVAVTPSGKISCIRKVGNANMHSTTLVDALEVACSVGVQLNASLNAFLPQTRTYSSVVPKSLVNIFT